MGPDDICPCPVWPVMLWQLADGSWVVGTVIDETADPERDADRFTSLGGTAWVATCPRCGCLFDAGEVWPT